MSAEPVEIWTEEPRGDYPDPALFGLSGLELLRTYSRSQSPRPPISHLIGTDFAGVGRGTAAFTMPAHPWLLSSVGLMTGGALAPVADGAFGCAAQSELPPATPYTTSELSMTFLRPVAPGGTLSASGQRIHIGRSVGLTEVFVIHEREGEERLVAHGTSRLAVMPPLDPVPEPPAEIPVIEPPTFDSPDPYLREPVSGEVLPQEVFDRMSGREILEAQIVGELPLPPIHYLTGLTLVEVGDGEATHRLPCTKWLTSPARTVQGGFTAMLADVSLQAAVMTTVPAGIAFAGLDLKVNYLRPAQADGRDLTSKATVAHRGRTLAVANAEITNADGKRVALATGSCIYLPDRPANLGELELPAS